MLCGKFRNELQVQINVNSTLQKVMENIFIEKFGGLEERKMPWIIDMETFEKMKKRKGQKKSRLDKLKSKFSRDSGSKNKKNKGQSKMDKIKEKAKRDLIRFQ